MADRRQVITGIAAMGMVGIAGCAATEEETEPEEDTNSEDGPEWVLPPDCNGLFQNGVLNDHEFVRSSFTEDQLNTDVSEFDLTNADTSNVEKMGGMFGLAESFNQDISEWDTSNVVSMNGMFTGATSFNQDIGEWDTRNVEFMEGMFAGAMSFNQDISGWDTSNVRDMGGMFAGAESFNQDISAWCVEQIKEKPSEFTRGVTLAETKQPNWGESC